MARVSVRTKYYKTTPALALLDHCSVNRNGFTKSANVKRQYSHNNLAFVFGDAATATERFLQLQSEYKNVTGRKTRSDFNSLFEHVVILSEQEYSRLEEIYGVDETKQRVMRRFIKYAKSIESEFGFTPCGIDFHLDEGTEQKQPGIDQVQFKRNIHCHISFFNYCFKRKFAPLRHLRKNGLDINGRTNSLNPNFVKMQDLAAKAFQNTPFKRGISKDITKIKHLPKEAFVRRKIQLLNQELRRLNNVIEEVEKLAIRKCHEALKNLKSKIKSKRNRKQKVKSTNINP